MESGGIITLFDKIGCGNKAKAAITSTGGVKLSPAICISPASRRGTTQRVNSESVERDQREGDW